MGLQTARMQPGAGEAQCVMTTTILPSWCAPARRRALRMGRRRRQSAQEAATALHAGRCRGPGRPGRGPRRGWRPAAGWGRRFPSGLAAGPPPPSPAVVRGCPGPPFPLGRSQAKSPAARPSGRSGIGLAHNGAGSSLAADHLRRGVPGSTHEPNATAGIRRRGAMRPAAVGGESAVRPAAKAGGPRSGRFADGTYQEH
jgi:hypothetical protein